MASNFIAYLDSVKARDPAARSRWEVLLYPGAWALAFHRVAHWLYGGRLYFLARLCELEREIAELRAKHGADLPKVKSA